MPRLLVFDLDNTLLHSQIDFAGIRRDVVSLWHRENITDRSVEELRTLSIGQIIELGAPHDAERNTNCVEAAWNIVLDYERRGMSVATVEPDAATTLQMLKDGEHALAILTNNTVLVAFPHTITSALLVASTFVAGVGAWLMVRAARAGDETRARQHRSALVLGLGF